MRFDYSTSTMLTVYYTQPSGTAGVSPGVSEPNGGTAQIRLDTTAGDSAPWIVTFLFNGTTLGTGSIPAANHGTLTTVGYNSLLFGSTAGTVGNFSLSLPIPEPSTYATFLSAGVGMMLCISRRRRSV